MARRNGQKLKLLYLLKILTEESDEQHMLSSAQLLDRLMSYGIKAERKSLYDDIEQLQQFGYDIICVKSKTRGGYYLSSREFELPELKLLVDAVQASKFMTVKKSRELIGKLERFASREEARQLQRQVYVAGRIKTEQENIYYNVDAIHRALQEQVQISFFYMEWGLDGRLHPKGESGGPLKGGRQMAGAQGTGQRAAGEKKAAVQESGKRYRISPWALLWSDENYYMIGFDGEAGIIKHYRVDKMQRIEPLSEKLQGEEVFAGFDLAAYANRTFSMYGGQEREVTLLFENRLAGVVMDRFGRETAMRPVDEGHFRVRVQVAVSGQFFGWLTGLGKGVRLLEPIDVVEGYQRHIRSILSAYEGKQDGRKKA